MLQRSEIIFTLALCLLASIILLLSQERPCPSPQQPTQPTQPFSRPNKLPDTSSISNLPIDTTPTPYNEDLIVSLINELYKTLLNICYFPDDSITFAPPEGHSINTTICESLNMDPAVISLLKRIPYNTYAWPGDNPLFPFSSPPNYLDDSHLNCGRDPDLNESTDYLIPQDITIGMREDRNGDDYILDTKENTIRISSFSGPHPYPEGEEGNPKYKKERPDEEFHYRNNYAQNAPSFFRRYIDKIKTLELLPSTHNYPGFKDSMDPLYHPMKKLLQEKYGWPDDFKRDEWKQDMESLWEQVKAEYDP